MLVYLFTVIPPKKWLGTLLLSAATLAQIFSISSSLTVVHNNSYSYPFNYAVMPFLAELIKLVVTVCWAVLKGSSSELFNMRSNSSSNSWAKWRIYAVLAFIYMLINNIVFLALQHLSPVSYVAIGNVKTVTTAVFFLVCLGRNLTHLQWHALGLLTIGALMTQVKSESVVIFFNFLFLPPNQEVANKMISMDDTIDWPLLAGFGITCAWDILVYA